MLSNYRLLPNLLKYIYKLDNKTLTQIMNSIYERNTFSLGTLLLLPLTKEIFDWKRTQWIESALPPLFSSYKALLQHLLCFSATLVYEVLYSAIVDSLHTHLQAQATHHITEHILTEHQSHHGVTNIHFTHIKEWPAAKKSAVFTNAIPIFTSHYFSYLVNLAQHGYKIAFALPQIYSKRQLIQAYLHHFTPAQRSMFYLSLGGILLCCSGRTLHSLLQQETQVNLQNIQTTFYLTHNPYFVDYNQARISCSVNNLTRKATKLSDDIPHPPSVILSSFTTSIYEHYSHLSQGIAEALIQNMFAPYSHQSGVALDKISSLVYLVYQTLDDMCVFIAHLIYIRQLNQSLAYLQLDCYLSLLKISKNMAASFCDILSDPSKKDTILSAHNVLVKVNLGRDQDPLNIYVTKISLKAASITRLYGKSGIGKSCLFDALAYGINLNQCRSLERREIYTLPQHYSLDTNLTLKEILLGQLEDSEENLELVNTQLRELKLKRFKDLLNGSASQLAPSGGELKRLALIQAINSHKPLVFLDEPFEAVDHDTVPLMKQFIKKAAAEATISRAFFIIDHTTKITDSSFFTQIYRAKKITEQLDGKDVSSVKIKASRFK